MLRHHRIRTQCSPLRNDTASNSGLAGMSQQACAAHAQPVEPSLSAEREDQEDRGADAREKDPMRLYIKAKDPYENRCARDNGRDKRHYQQYPRSSLGPDSP
jgi:hypothetical protein